MDMPPATALALRHKEQGGRGSLRAASLQPLSAGRCSPNVDGSLHLVPRQHPYLDACLGEPIDGLRDLGPVARHKEGEAGLDAPQNDRTSHGVHV